MAYAVEADLVEVLTPMQRLALLDDDSDGTETVGLATLLLVGASAEIDGIISARYAVPLTTTPATIKHLCLRIARAKAYYRRASPPETIVDDYALALEMLGRIASGEIGIGVDPRPTERSGLTVTMTSATRVFGRTNLSGL
ncbi:MAG: DUF1320 domain-containing protein [Nocardioides sp.]|jgi:phage gp36-like protein